VNIKYHKPLHYVLIILLILAPLRSAMAAQQVPCDMADMDMGKTSMSVSDTVQASAQSHDMSLHEMPADQIQTNQSAADHQCCCCDSDCVSNCDMGVTASLVMQASSYSPVYVNASNSISFKSEILVRALTPPSRPPAYLS
jgi:hypothetical protein